MVVVVVVLFVVDAIVLGAVGATKGVVMVTVVVLVLVDVEVNVVV